MFNQKLTRPARSAAPVSRKHRPDYMIVLFIGMLALLGLIVLFAISPARVEQINLGGESLALYYFMEKQVLYLGIGAAAFVAAALIPFSFWHKYRVKLLLVGLAASLLLSILGFLGAGLAQCSLGACRWYDFGFITFQPAELLKFGVVIFLAGFLAQRIKAGRINDVGNTLVPVAILLAVVLALVVGLQKDMGSGIPLVGIVLCMLFMAGLKLRYFAAGVGVLTVGIILMIVTVPHRIERMTTFFSPASNPDTIGYHIMQAMIAIGSGGFFGKGLGQSIQAFGYLPEANNDSIFAILGETFGFVGVLAILAIFMGLFVRLLKVMDTVSDPYIRLLVAGVFGWIVAQSIVNIGAMLGVIPLTGVTLPFLSFGGTSLLFIMTAMGMVYQASRYTSHGANQQEAGSSSLGRKPSGFGTRTAAAAGRGTGRIRRS